MTQEKTMPEGLAEAWKQFQRNRHLDPQGDAFTAGWYAALRYMREREQNGDAK